MRSRFGSEKRRKSFFIYLAAFLVLAVAGASLINMQVEISQKRAEKAEISSNLSVLLSKNEQLARYAEDGYKMDYIEQIARDQLDYSLPDETVYYFIPE